MIEALPKVSTAGNFLIMAFFLTIRCTPMDKTIVTIAGKPSGIADTARETAVIKTSIISILDHIPTKNITAHASKAIAPRYFPSLASFCCKGVFASFSFDNRLAIFPNSVFIPVATTRAIALP